MSDENVERAFRMVDFTDFQEGIRAYACYQRTLAALAEFYGYTLESTVGAFCALSPNNDYHGNLRSTATVMLGLREGWPVEDITVTTFNACKLRAVRFLQGEPFLKRTRGKKTRSFYLNIMDPWDPDPVTIDGHMIGLWRGRRMTMTEAAVSGFKYDDIARDFRTVAARHRLLPNQLQAMLWFTWKRIHDVRAVHQLNLLSPRDHWGLEVRPEAVVTFPRKRA